MIRIKTSFPNSLNREIRVLTLFYDGRWFSFAPDQSSRSCDSLIQAGQNHLEMAQILKQKLSTAGVCGSFSIKS